MLSELRQLVIELTEVAVVPVSEVGDGFAHAEGRGYADAAAWRVAHEELFTSAEVTACLGFTPVIHDRTLVVIERFRVAGDETGRRSSRHCAWLSGKASRRCGAAGRALGAGEPCGKI